MNNIIINDNFRLKEFECPCCKTVKLSSDLLKKLARFRHLVNRPVNISSGYRCLAYNTQIKGYHSSYHMKGMAADIFVMGPSLQSLSDIAKEIGFTGIIIYLKKNFLHLDVRPGKQKIWKDPS